MRQIATLVALGLAPLALGVEANASATANALLAAPLETSAGKPVTLESFAARPLVVFYEDKDSARSNQPLKDELFARGKERGLAERVTVVGVANLAGWNWPPARQFAWRGAADAEKTAGVPILIDWGGALMQAPAGLPDGKSTVLLVHRGEVLFRVSGPLDVEARARFFDTLESVLP